MRIIFVALLIISLSGCQRKKNPTISQKDKSVYDLLKDAGNDSISINTRLVNAFEADSIAIFDNNIQEQLKSEKMIAGLYLKLDSSMLAKTYFFKTIALAEKLLDVESIGTALNNIGIIYNQISKYDSALKYYNQAVEVFQRNGNRLHVGQGLVNIGIVYKIQSDYETAFKITLDAVKILDSLGAKKELSVAYITLGNILSELYRPAEAIQYLKLGLKIKTDERDSIGIAGALNSIGNIYRKNGDYTNAIMYYQNALAIKEYFGLRKGIGTTLDNMAEVYFELFKYDTAEMYFNKALQLRDARQDAEGTITTLNKLTKLYLKRKEISKAEKTALRAYKIMPVSGLLKQKSENTLLLADIYRELKQFEKATDFASRGLVLRDSLFNLKMAEIVLQLSVRYKTQEKEKELLLAKQLQSAQASQIQLQLYFILLLTGILILLCTTVLLLYKASEYRKKAKQKVDLLMTELNHRVKNNLQVMSDMLNLQIYSTTDDNNKATISAIRNRIQSMGILHKLLQNKEHTGAIDMKSYVEAIVTNLQDAFENEGKAFIYGLDINRINLNSKYAISIGLILNELITNIYKYANADHANRNIEIRMISFPDKYILYVTDNCGYWDMQAKHNKGFGLTLVSMLIEQLEGSYNIHTSEIGTTHLIEFQEMY